MSRTPAKAFGEAVRKARSGKGLTQEETAIASGLDRSYYGHLERATRGAPSLTTIWDIAEALDVKPSALLIETEAILRRGDRTER